MKDFLYKAKSVVIGSAVADALGVPVEFSSRAELMLNPVRDMMGYGTFHVPAGSWSDDTSMALCALDVMANGKQIDYSHIMDNFCKWYYEGEFTPEGLTFDAGNTCVEAILNYKSSGVQPTLCGPRDEYSNGNGSLMRIHPFVLYGVYMGYGEEQMTELVKNASDLTHGHERTELACLIYTCILEEILREPSEKSIAKGLKAAKLRFESYSEFSHYARIFEADFAKTPVSDIRSGGYVVETLEAAIWCLLNTNTYEECALLAVNLGKDTDTTAAVAGALAGAIYGYDAIPTGWKNTLLKREYMEELCALAFNK